MYDKEGKIVDRREMLKVKAKSLVEEARIIRFEERKLDKYIRHASEVNSLYQELHWHRVGTVRLEARCTYLAYGLIKGKPLDKIEMPKEPRTDYLWKKVKAMIEKYGPTDTSKKSQLLSLCSN